MRFKYKLVLLVGGLVMASIASQANSSEKPNEASKHRVNVFTSGAKFKFKFDPGSLEDGAWKPAKYRDVELTCQKKFSHAPHRLCEDVAKNQICSMAWFSRENYSKRWNKEDFYRYCKSEDASANLHYTRYNYYSFVDRCVEAQLSQCWDAEHVMSWKDADTRFNLIENLLNNQHVEEIDALNNLMSSFREKVKQELIYDLKKTLQVIDAGEGKKIQLEITIKSEGE